MPVKHLSLEEIASRKEKGLCFNCDEKFSCRHKCSSKFFLLIASNDHHQEGDLVMDPFPDVLDSTDSPLAQISLHALSGHLAP